MARTGGGSCPRASNCSGNLGHLKLLGSLVPLPLIPLGFYNKRDFFIGARILKFASRKNQRYNVVRE